MYTVINDKNRVDFEKKNFLPYGYSEAIIFNKFIDALNYLKDVQEQYQGGNIDNVRDYVIEHHKHGNSEIIYKGTFLYH